MGTLTEKNFVDRLEESFILDGFLTKREVNVGYGIADLVLIDKKKINKEKLNERKNYNQVNKLLYKKYFEILDLLPDISPKIIRKKINFDTLSKKLDISRSYLKYTLLKYLEENGFIKKDDNNCYFKINDWIPLANEIIAIEAKLKDWKRGSLQAYRYKSFAHKSYLVVPNEIESLVEKTFFKKNNIGLIFFNYKNKQRKIALECSKEKPKNNFMANTALEFFWEDKTLKELSII